MKIILSFLVLTLATIACGGTPTPSETDIYFATLEAEKIARQNYFSCTSGINDQVSALEQSASACLGDYDCKAKISQQIQELGEKLESTCTPVPQDMSSDFACKIRLIQAKASYAYGAPS